MPRVVPMLPSGGGAAGGRVVVANGRAALVNSMATPPSGRTYQAWGLPAGGGAPVPLPTFSTPGDVVIVPDAGKYARCSSRSSRAAGSKAPSAAPIAAAKL